MVLQHELKNHWKKAKILHSQNEAMLLVKTFLIHNSKTKILSDMHFWRKMLVKNNIKKIFSEKSHYKTFQET